MNFAPFQEVEADYPHIPHEQFERGVSRRLLQRDAVVRIAQVERQGHQRQRFVQPDAWSILANLLYWLLLIVVTLAKVIALAIVAFGLIASAVGRRPTGRRNRA